MGVLCIAYRCIPWFFRAPKNPARMSDVAVSDLKGGHAPAQKVFIQVLHLNARTFSRNFFWNLDTGWWNEGGDKAKSE